MGDVIRPLPSSASLAIPNPASAQQLGIAWGGPLCLEFITTTPELPHALAALLFPPHLTSDTRC
jgi:hypothetical protein